MSTSVTSLPSSVRRSTGPGEVRWRWDRRLARCLSRRLDSRLATGQPPHEGTLLGVRASVLCELATRWQLADSWEAILAIYNAPAAIGPWRVSPRCDRIDAAGHAITQLIAALRSAELVDPSGVAMARLLLTDGTGPLYAPASRLSLSVAVQRCLRGLDMVSETLAAPEKSSATDG